MKTIMHSVPTEERVIFGSFKDDLLTPQSNPFQNITGDLTPKPPSSLPAYTSISQIET